MTDTPTPISATDIGERIRRKLAGKDPIALDFHGWIGVDPQLLADALAVIEAQERTIADLKQGLDQIIGERDGAEEWADCLAYAIAPVEIIGEHSSMNNPWSAAIEALAGQRQVTERTIADLTARTTPPEGMTATPEAVACSVGVEGYFDAARLIRHAYLPEATS